jgi:hypothetical protein
VDHAVWCPDWYDFDQSIAVGLTAEFAFWNPDYLDREGLIIYGAWGNRRLGFYNQDRDTLEKFVVADGTIRSIRHHQLGHVQRVDTSGAMRQVFCRTGRFSTSTRKNNRAASQMRGLWTHPVP